MDCIVPSHSIKTLCSAIATLSRIGKDLYLEFDPIEGLMLHTLNDAKSAYASFRFRSTFFERCTTVPETLSQAQQRIQKKRKKASSIRHEPQSKPNPGHNTNERTQRHRVLKPTEQSSSVDDRTFPVVNNNDNASGYDDSNKTSGNKQNNNNHESDDETDDESDDGKFICRVPLRAMAAVVRPRRGAISLRIRSENTSRPNSHVHLEDVDSRRYNDDNDYHQDNIHECIGNESLRSFLSFEFQLRSSTSPSSAAFSSNHGAASGPVITVTHRVRIANETSCQRATVQKEDASELIASPGVWLRLLEPVINQQRSNEVVLIVRNRNDDSDINNNHGTAATATGAISSVSATTFNYSTDTYQGLAQQHYQRRGKTSTASNAVLNAASFSMMKTETSLGWDELDEFDFISNRVLDNQSATITMPDYVNEQAILVFCLKETKAMLQFCASYNHHLSLNNSSGYSNFVDLPELAVSLSFHWGGKPLVIETTTATANRRPTSGHSAASITHPVTATLVLATLDHTLLSWARTMTEAPP